MSSHPDHVLLPAAAWQVRMATACKAGVKDERGALWQPMHWPAGEEQIGMMAENTPNNLGEILIQLLLRASVAGPADPSDGAAAGGAGATQVAFNTDVMGQSGNPALHRFVTVREMRPPARSPK